MVEALWDELLQDSYCSNCLEFVPVGAEVRPIVGGVVTHIVCRNGEHVTQLPRAYAVDLTTGVMLTPKEWHPERALWGGHIEVLDMWETISRARAAVATMEEDLRNAGKDWSHVVWSGEYPKLWSSEYPKVRAA